MNFNLIDDVSTLTTIKKSQLNRLCKIVELLVADDMIESIRAGEQVLSIDIGVGQLALLVDNTGVTYKFTPSKQLESKIHDVLLGKEEPLEKELEVLVCKKMITASKNLL